MAIANGIDVTDKKIVNPADVHMETAPFSDADVGDTHACSDWEIWTVAPAQRVWVTSCVGGVLAVHTHLGDGVFENSHAGRTELFPETDYVLRVRLYSAWESGETAVMHW